MTSPSKTIQPLYYVVRPPLENSKYHGNGFVYVWEITVLDDVLLRQKRRRLDDVSRFNFPFSCCNQVPRSDDVHDKSNAIKAFIHWPVYCLYISCILWQCMDNGYSISCQFCNVCVFIRKQNFWESLLQYCNLLPKQLLNILLELQLWTDCWNESNRYFWLFEAVQLIESSHLIK